MPARIEDETMTKLTMRMARASLREAGVTIKHDAEWGEYVVRLRGSAAGAGYHTSDLADAFQTGHAMARDHRQRVQDVSAMYATRDALERAKREEEAFLGLPRGTVKN